MITVWLRFGERGTVDERLAIQHPEDADAGFLLSTLCWWMNIGSHFRASFIPALIATKRRSRLFQTEKTQVVTSLGAS